MNRAGAVLAEFREVLGGPVSLMGGKLKLRIGSLQCHHQSIAGDLGNDRCRGDARGSRIPLCDRPLRQGVTDAIRPIDDQILGFWTESIDRNAHRLECRLKDVDRVDLARIDHAHALRHTSIGDHIKQLIALLGRQFF